MQRAAPRVKRAAMTRDASHLPRLAARVQMWGPGDAAARIARADEICHGNFEFVGVSRHLDTPTWLAREHNHLWSYNLHYFDYALDLAWAFRLTNEQRYVDRLTALVGSWMLATHGGRGDGWDPYPISVRVVNWMFAYLLVRDHIDEWFAVTWLSSIHEQLQTLDRRLEWHILGNHLYKNLHALVIGGLFFSGTPDAQRWRGERLRLLWREVYEQILADGVHYERSPMYHALVARDFLQLYDLLRASGIHVGGFLEDRLITMVEVLGRLCREDGSFHLLNDSANGVAPTQRELAELAANVLSVTISQPEGAWELPAAGYFGFRDGDFGERLIVDCGEPGPAYQPGHAHCDLLSFELELHGQAVIVDSGVNGYEGDVLREYVRSTRAHNTIMIGGKEQHEIWGTYRIARRAQISGAELRVGHQGFEFVGSCRPYHALDCEHSRTIKRLAAGAWSIADAVSGARGERIDSFLHFHPDARLSIEGDKVIAKFHALQIVINTCGFDELSAVCGVAEPLQGWYAPEFGRALPAPVLRGTILRHDGREFGWEIRSLAGESR